LNRIGREWVLLRDGQGRSKAFASLQRNIMSNLGVIAPNFASMKECVSITLDIENFRESKEATGKTVDQMFAEYLCGEDS
jgi:hypothetical protein